MTFIQEIRDALKQGQDLFALDRGEYLNVYMWARNERKKGKDAGIKGCRNGEYLVWHEDLKRYRLKDMKIAKKIVLGCLGLWIVLMIAITIGKILYPNYPWETLTQAPKIGDIF